MRIQLEDAAGNDYCATIPSTNTGTIPWGDAHAEELQHPPRGRVLADDQNHVHSDHRPDDAQYQLRRLLPLRADYQRGGLSGPGEAP